LTIPNVIADNRCMASPSTSKIEYRETCNLPRDEVLALYRSVGWSSAEKPDRLMAALAGSHAVVTAWHGDRLVGLGNTISDGALVVYYPHLVVHPEYQHRGVGREIVRRLQARYEGFHQHSILADDSAVEFYEKCGFTRPAAVQAMWIYAGRDHGE
jgi:GNAT superfamily N-acetyltransferase